MIPHSNEAYTERCACGHRLMGSESGHCPECGRNLAVDGSQPIATYREHLPGQWRDFTLYMDRVMVLSRRWSGTGEWQPVRLDRLGSLPTTVWVRSPLYRKSVRFLNISLGILAAAAVWQNANGFSVPFTLLCASLVIPSAIAALRTMRVTEFVRFHSREHAEIIPLTIARSGPDADAFNHFVSQIKSAIQASRYSSGDWVLFEQGPK